MISEKWLKKYELAKRYYKEHGNLLVPRVYKIELNNEIIDLGAWINNQRQAYKNINNRYIDEKRIKLLEKIGMVWSSEKSNDEILKSKWLRKYELAKKYYEEHGDLLVPRVYKIELNNEIIDLGAWINNQRQAYKNRNNRHISEKRIKLLEEIGMVWSSEKSNDEILKSKWLRKYELAKKYYEEHGDLLIPFSYVVTSADEKINLGAWMNTQRLAYKGTSSSKINEEQISKLEEIGMIWDVKTYKDIDKYLEEQYILYEKGMLDEQQITKLLKEGIFMYSDLDKTDKLQKANTLEFYRKKY